MERAVLMAWSTRLGPFIVFRARLDSSVGSPQRQTGCIAVQWTPPSGTIDGKKVGVLPLTLDDHHPMHSPSIKLGSKLLDSLLFSISFPFRAGTGLDRGPQAGRSPMNRFSMLVPFLLVVNPRIPTGTAALGTRERLVESAVLAVGERDVPTQPCPLK